ncbi:hypothetical protein BDZ85DRAFT_278422 [Elsinoe ampelina]|uniref:Uncharacterized protein n=1 Tax=Elsinoe ampelina TaxID=302913 RepID=A0A6A6GL36_9PEZI|nr:hypothetical protein BDZ85DRAFT_278422 [Elsinoe ampelina]
MSAIRWWPPSRPDIKPSSSKRNKPNDDHDLGHHYSKRSVPGRIYDRWRQTRVGPFITVREDPETLEGIQNYLLSRQSETEQALAFFKTQLIAKYGRRCLTRLWMMVHMRCKKGEERRGRLATPAAIRQMPVYFPDMELTKSKIPSVQLVPRRRHASSGYQYPVWLQDYGVSREDWNTFVTRFIFTNKIRVSQYILNLLAGGLVESFLIAGFPIKAVAFLGVVVPPFYFVFKARSLRKAVKHGSLPCWTACWNKTYFGPKGLSVGFDLPGPVFPDTFVHPRRKFWLPSRVLHSELKKPMQPSRAARRARITIARVRGPVPEAGRIPNIDPLKLGFLQMIFHEMKARPRAWIDEHERRARELKIAIDKLKARRRYLEELVATAPALPPRPVSPLVVDDSDSGSSISTINSIIVKDMDAPRYVTSTNAERMKQRRDYIATIPGQSRIKTKPRKRVKFAKMTVIYDEDEEGYTSTERNAPTKKFR